MLQANYKQLGLSPDAKLDFGVDWSQTDYIANGDTVSASVWDVPTGVTQTDGTFISTATTVWLNFTDPDTVQLGSTYTITNHITTEGGREDDQSFILVCVQE
jgi:hypothetical protein